MLCAGRPPLVVEAPHPVTQRAERRTAEAVEHLSVGVALLEAPLVGLSVHRDQVSAQLGQHADRSGPPTHMGARPPRSAERPRDDELPVLMLGARLGGPVQRGVAGRQLDDSLHERLVGAASHQGGVSALAEEQAQPGHDHGLARARLPGQHVEAGAQVQHGVMDDADPADPHLAEHGSTLGPSTTSVGPPVHLV